MKRKTRKRVFFEDFAKADLIHWSAVVPGLEIDHAPYERVFFKHNLPFGVTLYVEVLADDPNCEDGIVRAFEFCDVCEFKYLQNRDDGGVDDKDDGGFVEDDGVFDEEARSSLTILSSTSSHWIEEYRGGETPSRDIVHYLVPMSDATLEILAYSCSEVEVRNP